VDNKEIAKRFYDAVNAGRLGIIDELVAENFVEHEEFPGLARGREGLRPFFEMIRTAFPDFSMTIEDMVAEGDKVFIRATMKGTQKGEFMGTAASGKQMAVPFADVVRLEGGRVVEHWGVTDTGSMMRQLTYRIVALSGTHLYRARSA
jgi:steroid delta-isomerase-like uncharacterized protein